MMTKKEIEQQMRVSFKAEYITEDALKCLTPREKSIVSIFCGLGGEPKSLREIAREYGVTNERVRQILERAQKKLRRGDAYERKENAIISSDLACVIVETDEENPVPIATLSNDFIDVADGYRVRLRSAL